MSVENSSIPSTDTLPTAGAIPPAFKGGESSRLKKLSKWLGPCLSIMILCVAIGFLHKELSSISSDTIITQIRSISWFHIVAALCCVFGSYFFLTLYDMLALTYLGKKIPYRKISFTAFIAYAVGHNVGFSAISGGTVRYRIYTLHGLTASDIAKITLFITVTFTIGISFLLGIALQIIPKEQTAILNLPHLMLQTVSLFLIGYPLAYIVATYCIKNSFRFGRWVFKFPHSNIALGQVIIALAELFCASATLYVLLADHLSISYFSFLGIYLLAMIAGIISSIPGGIGVFEAVLLAALPEMDRGILLATMIVYRIFYYILPLIIAMLLFLWHEIIHQHRLIKTSGNEKTSN